MIAYLQSEAGQRLLESVPPAKSYPYGRILNSMQGGSVLTIVGLALLLLRFGVPDGQEPLLVIGSLVLTLGLGLLVAAGIALCFSKSWRLINGEKS